MASTLTFAVPVEWSKTTAYDANVVVFIGKKAYTSLKSVPTGVEINDTTYWAETGVPQKTDTTQLKSDIESLKSTVSTLQTNLETTNSNVTTNANMLNFAIRVPIKSPNSVAIASPITIASIPGIPFCMHFAMITLVRASCAPTERSIPSVSAFFTAASD